LAECNFVGPGMRLIRFLQRNLAAAAAVLLAGAAPAADNAGRHDAELVWAQRPIATFRVAYNGADPPGRVARALARIAELEARALPLEFDEVPIAITESGAQRTGIALRAADIVLFTLLAEDLEPGHRLSLPQTMAAAHERLKSAVSASRAQRRPDVMMRGLLHALAATLVAGLAFWLLIRALAHIGGRLQAPDAPDSPHAPVSLAAHGRALVLRAMQIAGAAVGFVVAYAWLAYVLHEFPATMPLSLRLGELVWQAFANVGTGIAAAIPGLIAVALIMLFAEGLSRAARGAFRSVQSGRLTIPGLHRETAGATRRIVVFGIWVLAVVAAYPYIPGSGSGVFQGISVLIGAMVTLGSSGISNQIMSGLTLVYSRALKRGDHVVIGAPGSEVEGVVTEIGALATRIVTMRNQEATVPNAVVVGNPIRNFSRQAGDDGTLVSAKVSIGYDAPWRQVHAMLEEAARRTSGIRTQPAPRVIQGSLADFYVEYELLVNIDRPLDRLQIMSTLNASIQDVFNEYGVQIMSPHFLGQPAESVVVPQERWHAAPAVAPR
jgi:small-conductance mechanosensitive channel